MAELGLAGSHHGGGSLALCHRGGVKDDFYLCRHCVARVDDAGRYPYGMQNLTSFCEHPTNLCFRDVEVPMPGPGRNASTPSVGLDPRCSAGLKVVKAPRAFWASARLTKVRRQRIPTVGYRNIPLVPSDSSSWATRHMRVAALGLGSTSRETATCVAPWPGSHQALA
jgi:hypothetical protein